MNWDIAPTVNIARTPVAWQNELPSPPSGFWYFGGLTPYPGLAKKRQPRPGSEDEGLDMEVEFTDDEGRGTAKRIYLQLKSGNAYLQRRKGDGAEIFRIKKQSWLDYWMKQDRPVLLVIGTFPEDREGSREESEERFEDIRWMEITEEVLSRESKGGTQPVKQIVFKGETLNTMSVRGWRDRALRQGWV